MKNPEYRKIKVRKRHECSQCNAPIERGWICEYLEFKGPKYNDNDKQVGIVYFREYVHIPCLAELCQTMYPELPF